MSQGKSVAALPSSFQAMTANIVVTMDDVVSAFVSKYEEQLFRQKKLLGAELTRSQAALKEFVDSIREQFDASKYNVDLFSQFGLRAEAKDTVYLDWGSGKAGFEVQIRLTADTSSHSYYGSNISLTTRMYEAIAPEARTTHEQHVRLIESQQASLAEVLDRIKSVARKEREVRGRIAMRKIEDSGYASLLDDDELLKLVQL